MRVRAVGVDGGAPREFAHRLLVEFAVDARGRDSSGEPRLDHDCARCGSTDHGRPRLVGTAGDRWPPVSLSRAPGLIVLALGAPDRPGGRVGVDVEPDGAARFASFAAFADVVLHPGEWPPAGSWNAQECTRTWVRKEAVLKALGTGLHLDPRHLRLSGPGEAPAVLELDDPTGAPESPVAQGVRVIDLDVAPGFTAALAVIEASADGSLRAFSAR